MLKGGGKAEGSHFTSEKLKIVRKKNHTHIATVGPMTWKFEPNGFQRSPKGSSYLSSGAYLGSSRGSMASKGAVLALDLGPPLAFDLGPLLAPWVSTGT